MYTDDMYYGVNSTADAPIGDAGATIKVGYFDIEKGVLPPQVFNKPQDLKVTFEDGEIVLNWREVAAGYTGTLVGYNIYKNGELLNETEPSRARTYADTEVSAGVNYMYYVTAVYSGPEHETEPSNVVVTQASATPSNVEVSVDNGLITITWDTPAATMTVPDARATGDLAGYYIYRYGRLITSPYIPLGTNSYVDNTNGNLYNGEWEYAVTAVYLFVDGDDVLEVESMISETNSITADNEQVGTLLKSELLSNYPNPFNPSTTIKYSLAREGQVTIDIFNIRGQKINTLVNGVMSAGLHTVQWNGDDADGKSVSSGIYFYRMNNEGTSSVKKMILMK
jgi:hypothetical protein